MFKRMFICFIPLLFITNIAFANEFDYSRKDFQEIINMLDMEGHGNDDVATCPVKQLYYKEVADMLEKGMNKEEILAYYVNQMGEQALKAPTKKGFSLLAWTIPFVILFIAVLFVYYAIRKWTRKNKKQQGQHVKTEIPNENEKNSLIDFIETERKKYF